jgi:two-component system sensor kinase FixL
LEVHVRRNELAHLSRVSLVAELSSSLAHELNQPLTAIMSNAQAAERFLDAPAPNLALLRQIVGDIASDDRRASEVIGRLRTLLKKAEPKFQILECGELVGDVLKATRGDMVAHDIDVTTDVALDLPAITGDRIQLQQVVINLLVNAVDAVAAQPPHARRITVRAAAGEAGTVEVAVADNGTGIPADRIGRVFEPFFTTKADGLGMGLSISRAIVESHGGRLWATNNPDRGATFHMALPAAP